MWSREPASYNLKLFPSLVYVNGCSACMLFCSQRTEEGPGYLGTGDVSGSVGAANPTLTHWKSHFSSLFLGNFRVVFFF